MKEFKFGRGYFEKYKYLNYIEASIEFARLSAIHSIVYITSAQINNETMFIVSENIVPQTINYVNNIP